MKLEVGMYVRTKNGIIAKCKDFIVGIYRFDNIIKRNLVNISFELFEEEIEINILKASNNIIDLIEENDIVCYRIGGELYYSQVFSHPEFDKFKLHIMFADTIINLEDLQIVSIVTKEQFSSMEYKI